MPTITAARIADDWRCHAVEPLAQMNKDVVPLKGCVIGHRCEASGARYRDGQWGMPTSYGHGGERVRGQWTALRSAER
jgi:hypothetical protein